jgi:hypothetical protein
MQNVFRLVRAYEQATASTTVRAFWVETGFQHEERDVMLVILD